MPRKVDKAGHISHPKPARDRLRLREGSELILEEHIDAAASFL